MRTIAGRLSRYFGLARQYGLRAALHRGWSKLLSYLGLQVRAWWWTVRAGHLWSDKEMMAQTGGGWGCLEELIIHLSNKSSAAFLFSPAQKEEYVELLRESYPGAVERIVSTAERIGRHQFHFLGGDLSFGADIDWHQDPKSGLGWPREYFEKIDRRISSGERLGDLKLPWELNRHQYFCTLGKAYWVTGDEGYAREFSHQVLSWIRQNPEGIGINWYSALEIGVRLMSWALAFHFFRDSRAFIEEAGAPFLKSLYRQACFLRDHLSLDWKVRNNHILGEVSALVFVACLFPEFKQADEWLRTGLGVLESELELQTYPDGVNKEQATGYHRFVLDFLLLIVVLTRRGALPESQRLEKLAEKMLGYSMHLSSLGAGVPMIGDADDGRGYVLDEGADFWDFSEGLAVGAVLFQRPDFKLVSLRFGEGAFWLLGPEGLRAFERMGSAPPAAASVSFPRGGIYILRDNWTSGSDYALLRSGAFGLGGDGFCAHAHCDLLSFVLQIQGMPVIVDSGTFTYYGPWRDFFRLTAAHNTLVVDGHEQAEPRSEFSWKNVPSPAECLVWEENRLITAMRVTPDVMHRRELRHPRPGLWELADSLEGQGRHDLSWFFHYAPDLRLGQAAKSKHVRVDGPDGLHLEVIPPAGVVPRIASGWYSSSYGERKPNPLLVATWHGELSAGGEVFRWMFSCMQEAERGEL